jgi:alkylhydroperoxidase family enzyme
VPRIREVDEGNVTGEQKRLLDDDVEFYGQVLNTTRLYAYVPDLVPPLRVLHGALAGGGLPEGLVSLARLRVAQINGCPF